MKKRVLLCVSVSIMLGLTACNGVSQQDYDTLVSQKEKIESDYSNLKKEYDDLNKEYTEKKEIDLKNVSDSFILSTAKNWAKTSFGDGATCSLDDNKHLTVNVPSNYTTSNMPEIFDTLKKSLTTWVYIDSPTSDTTNYEYVTINFYDNNKNGIVSYSFNNKDKKFELKTVMGNLDKVDEIISSIQKK